MRVASDRDIPKFNQKHGINAADWASCARKDKAMTPETFADGIGRIGFSEGMVRIELVSVADQDKDGKAIRELRHRVVMTPQGFLQSVQAQLNLLRELEEAGVIRRAPASGAEAAASPSNGTPRSPNF
jgi:hypothetical protein